MTRPDHHGSLPDNGTVTPTVQDQRPRSSQLPMQRHTLTTATHRTDQPAGSAPQAARSRGLGGRSKAGEEPQQGGLAGSRPEHPLLIKDARPWTRAAVRRRHAPASGTVIQRAKIMNKMAVAIALMSREPRQPTRLLKKNMVPVYPRTPGRTSRFDDRNPAGAQPARGTGVPSGHGPPCVRTGDGPPDARSATDRTLCPVFSRRRTTCRRLWTASGLACP
jgi:hypothetical protein